MSKNLRTEALINSIPPNQSVLDIGCVQHDAGKVDNDDWVHGQLYDIASDVTGVDFLESEVKKLQDQGYNVVCANAETMDLGETFDVIVAGELIEHLSNLGDFLDNVHTHLEEDGVFILTTPNPWAFHRFKQALIDNSVNCNDEHTCWLDEKTLRQLFRRHGFDVDEINYVKASDPGITSILYDLGFDLLGGTSLLVQASLQGVKS